jgi:hypothetical protein
MSADYPTAVTTRLKTAVNNLNFSLSAAIGVGDPIVYVTSTTGAPSAGSFHVGNEVMYYTGKASDRFTGVLKGQDGTVDAAHDTVTGGNEVVFGPEAHHVNNLNEEMEAVQTTLGITGAFNFVDVTNAQTVAGVKTFSDTPKMDAIAEDTSDTGVTIDGVLLKDSEVTTDVINEDTSDTGVTIDGVLIKDDLETSGIAAYEESIIKTTITSSATPTPARASKKTLLVITAQAAAFELQNPTGTLVYGDMLWVDVTDNGTGRAITYDTNYADDYSAELPTDTTAGKTLHMLFRYDGTKLQLMWTDEEA